MPFVDDSGGFDQAVLKKMPESVHDRILRIARETCDPRPNPDEPLSAESRFEIDVNWDSLEAVHFMIEIEKEFGRFAPDKSIIAWFMPAPLRGCESFQREFFQFLQSHNIEFWRSSDLTLGHLILFFEERESACRVASSSPEWVSSPG